MTVMTGVPCGQLGHVRVSVVVSCVLLLGNETACSSPLSFPYAQAAAAAPDHMSCLRHGQGSVCSAHVGASTGTG